MQNTCASVILNVKLYMEKEKELKLYKPVDYAKHVGVTPSAVTRMINENRVNVVLVKGRRYIKA